MIPTFAMPIPSKESPARIDRLRRPPANLYPYVIFPAVAGVTPGQGPVTGGIPVTVASTNFSTAPGGTTFQIGSLSATNVSCASSTECTMTAPVRAANAGYLGGNVTATVNGRTSTNFVTFNFGTPPPPRKPIKPPPCKGIDCQQ